MSWVGSDMPAAVEVGESDWVTTACVGDVSAEEFMVPPQN